MISAQVGAGTEVTMLKPAAMSDASSGWPEAAIHPERAGAESTCTDCFREAFSAARAVKRVSRALTESPNAAT
ncbi:MAG: hypothetical protein ACKOKG_05020 [Verrucomicrobiota bacterium]